MAESYLDHFSLVADITGRGLLLSMPFIILFAIILGVLNYILRLVIR